MKLYQFPDDQTAEVRVRLMVQRGHARSAEAGRGLPPQGPGLSLNFLKHRNVLPMVLAPSTQEVFTTANQSKERNRRETIVTDML